MGMEIVVEGDGARSLAALLADLAAAGMVCAIQMVDGALTFPSAPPPAEWREVRLRTPAGAVSLKRRGAAIAVVVFGNADDGLQAAQRRIADALGGAKV